MDSLNKRIKFLNEVIGGLKLKDIEAIHGRAEDYARHEKYREQYDVCVSRAVANLSTLSEYSLPFVKLEDILFLIKRECRWGNKTSWDIDTCSWGNVRGYCKI